LLKTDFALNCTGTPLLLFPQQLVVKGVSFRPSTTITLDQRMADWLHLRQPPIQFFPRILFLN
jgi:hypothetical protein